MLSGINYSAFHGFGQAEFPDGGSVLGPSQFLTMPLLPQKYCSIQVVKIDPKIIISLH
jgi:hypothetical protein